MKRRLFSKNECGHGIVLPCLLAGTTRRLLFLMIGVGLLSLNALSEDAEPVPVTKVRVLKKDVNMRAKPSVTSETVGQVSENDELVIKSTGEEWIEIVPPSSVDLWVLGDYVKDGVVDSDKVNVRAGPGINFSIVGQLPRGAVVGVKGTHAQWMRIAPPETCSLWIHSSLVEIIPVPEEEAGPGTVDKVAEAELVEGESSEPGAETGESDVSAVDQAESSRLQAGITTPAGLDLVPSPVQGRLEQYEGVLRPRGFFFRSPSRYRLVTYDDHGGSATICYVKGNEAQLDALLNRHMVINGRQYWVQRSDYPVLVPERIVLKGK